MRIAKTFVLIDHRICGGSGCARCNERGTVKVVKLDAGRTMPSDADEFLGTREHCHCYEGISVNAGVSQCTHAGATDDGEWCTFERCPLVGRL